MINSYTLIPQLKYILIIGFTNLDYRTKFRTLIFQFIWIVYEIYLKCHSI